MTEPGWYWVRLKYGDGSAGPEEIGHLSEMSGLWTTCDHGSDEYVDSDFAEINERIERHPSETHTRLLLRAVNFGENAMLVLQETLRRLGPAAPPQPITDAQKTGERFFVWYEPEGGEREWPGQWYPARWDIDGARGWLVGGASYRTSVMILKDRFVTHYLHPPDVKP